METKILHKNHNNSEYNLVRNSEFGIPNSAQNLRCPEFRHPPPPPLNPTMGRADFRDLHSTIAGSKGSRAGKKNKKKDSKRTTARSGKDPIPTLAAGTLPPRLAMHTSPLIHLQYNMLLYV